MRKQINPYKPINLTTTDLEALDIELAERLTRRRFLIGAGALVVAGCGAPQARSPIATTGATRTITHALGESEVPANPRRVIALDAFFTLTPLVELGVSVVGSVSLGEPAQYPGLSPEESADITSIGAGRLVSLEAVASLDPDLIIGVDFVEPPYAQLSDIAPTVVIATALDWKAQHRALGEATGTLDQAEQGIAAYEARASALQSEMPDLSVSLFSLQNEGIYPMGPNAWAPARVLDDAGVQRPPNEIVGEDQGFLLPLSPELWPDIAGDVLLYTAGYPGIDDAATETIDTRRASPIWEQIPAVRAGRAHEVDGRCWETFGGLRSANCVLDDIERILINRGVEETQ